MVVIVRNTGTMINVAGSVPLTPTSKLLKRRPAAKSDWNYIGYLWLWLRLRPIQPNVINEDRSGTAGAWHTGFASQTNRNLVHIG